MNDLALQQYLPWKENQTLQDGLHSVQELFATEYLITDYSTVLFVLDNRVFYYQYLLDLEGYNHI